MADAVTYAGETPTLDELDQAHPGSIPPAVWIAICFAGGIAMAWHLAPSSAWPWIAAAVVSCVGAWFAHRLVSIIGLIGLCIAMLLLGVSWMTLRSAFLLPNDIAAHIGNERSLVRLRGVVLNTPEIRQRRAGSLAPFDFRRPATYFQLRVTALRGRDGELQEASGRVLVRVDDPIVPLQPGQTIDTVGYLLRAIGPHNPGEFDYERYARTLGQAGILTVPSRDLIALAPSSQYGLLDRCTAARESLRQQSSAWLLTNLSIADQPQRNALLAALLLGEREPALDGLMESFRHLGLAHLLAISGLHLGLLIGIVMLAARFAGRHGRWQGWLMIGVVLLYLFVVEVRAPVLRAGIMSIVASIGIAMNRRMRVSSLIALSAIALLIWRPQELFTAGFQLSYAVVLGLVLFTNPVRKRLSSRRPHEAFTVRAMLWEGCKTAAVVAMVAWLVAAPLVLHHFGFVSLVGIPLSITVTPIVSLILLFGYAKLILSILLPSAALLLSAPLVLLTDFAVSIAGAAELLPFASVEVPQPSVLWTIIALVWILAWFSMTSERWRRRIRLLALPIIIWLVLPIWLPATSAALRIDMLSVGDGSCYLLRSGRSAVIYDAGSSSSFDAGRRTIVPALRALRVRRIDAIIISHANLDHYSGVLELADAFNVREVFVSHQFLDKARSGSPRSHPTSFLTAELERRGVSLRGMSEGDEGHYSGMAWTCLHPRTDDGFRLTNDESLVIRASAAGRVVLLCGDIQRDAINTILERHPNLTADICELPHHGSHNNAAVAFMRRLNPAIVMQSTGWPRWRSDRWADALDACERLVTARDGACWVEVAHDGAITSGRFRSWVNAPQEEQDDHWRQE